MQASVEFWVVEEDGGEEERWVEGGVVCGEFEFEEVGGDVFGQGDAGGRREAEGGGGGVVEETDDDQDEEDDGDVDGVRSEDEHGGG